MRLISSSYGARGTTPGFGIKGFIPVSLLDWPGKVCAIVFLGGCGFRCPACHNPGLVLEPGSMPDLPLQEILGDLTARRGWIDGITVTGGEPTARGNLNDLLKILKKSGPRIKLDTNGSNPTMLRALIRGRLVDAVSMDVKAPVTGDDYVRVAGVPVDPRTILRSIEILKSSDIEVTFRTTVVPGLVEEPQLERIQGFLGQVPRYEIQPFRNGQTLDPALAKVEPFPPDRFDHMRLRFEIPSLVDAQPLRYACAG